MPLPSPMPPALRHTYRDLLRAATYLPDSACREFVHSRIVWRFRRVSIKIREDLSYSGTRSMAKYHGRDHIHATSRRARMLERAGLGSRDDLIKVLRDTYGRSGSRRFDLMKKFLVPEGDASSDSTSLEELIKAKINPVEEIDNKSSKPLERRFVNSKVETLIRSQFQNKPMDASLGEKRKIRTMKLQIPETNSWGNPFPLTRAKSLQKKDWKMVAENMLPPLPDHEWNRLRDLSLGVLPIEDIPRRRPRPDMEENVQGDRKASFLLDYFTQPVSQRRLGGLDKDKVIISEQEGATYLHTPRLPERNHKLEPHVHTSRYLRRLYASIWALTPKIEYDEGTKLWKTTWGDAKTQFLSGKAPSPGKDDKLFFESTENIKVEEVSKKGRREKRMPLSETVETTQTDSALEVT